MLSAGLLCVYNRRMLKSKSVSKSYYYTHT
jgi:hypothetical protein